MPKNVQITAGLGGLLVLVLALALVLWWPSDGLLGSQTPAGPGEAGTPTEQATGGTVGDPDSQAMRREEFAAQNASSNRTNDATTGSLRIRVLYGDDKSPASDIGVRVREVRHSGPRAPSRYVRTDAMGEVLVAGLAPGEVSVATRRQGMGYQLATVVAGKETEVVLTMRVGADVTGSVVDTEGVGVAGATVVLSGIVGSDPHAVATTDASGRFNLRQISRSSYLAARARGYTPSAFWPVAAAAGARVEVRIILPGVGGSVRGRVLDPEGRGVANAVVRIGPRRQPAPRIITLPGGSKGIQGPPPETLTDTEGRFLVEGLKPAALPVDVVTETFAPWSGSVEVEAHVTRSMIVRLSHGVALQGVVRNEKGEPMGQVDVVQGKYGSAEYRYTRTAQDGSYGLQGLPADKPILVKVRSEKQGTASKELQGRPGETLRWDVTLSRGLVLEGTVFGRDAKPLHSAQVVAWSGSWRGGGRTDKQGRFELTQCPKGPVMSLDVTHPGYEALHRSNVDVANGALALHMDWQGEQTARIIGSVVDPDGKPVTNALIFIGRRGAGGGESANTTAKGELKIENRPPGTYWLRIWAGGFVGHVTKERRIGSGETWNLGQVRLVRGGRLRVDLKLPREQAKEPVWLSVYLLDGRHHSGFNTDKRPLLSDPLAPGRHYLQVAGRRVFPQRIPFEIREGEETRQVVVPRFGEACVLQFALPSGSDKVHRIKITVTGADGFRHEHTMGRSRPRLVALSLGLIPGRYTARAVSEHGHRGQAEFEVKPDAGSPQAFRVEMK